MEASDNEVEVSISEAKGGYSKIKFSCPNADISAQMVDSLMGHVKESVSSSTPFPNEDELPSVELEIRKRDSITPLKKAMEALSEKGIRFDKSFPDVKREIENTLPKAEISP